MALRRSTLLGGLLSLCACSLISTSAFAQERVFLTGEAGVAFALNDPYGDAYGIGAVGAVGVFRSLLWARASGTAC
jgi:hypothetical protein